MKPDEKMDGIHFTIIKLRSEEGDYDLMWHEDMGNIIYSIKQDEKSIKILEKRLTVIVEQLNAGCPSMTSYL